MTFMGLLILKVNQIIKCKDINWPGFRLVELEHEVYTLLGREEEVIWQARRKAFSHFSVWLLQAALDQ